MKQTTLEVPDDRLLFFLELIDSLNFVEIADIEGFENQLSSAQQKAWHEIKAKP